MKIKFKFSKINFWESLFGSLSNNDLSNKHTLTQIGQVDLEIRSSKVVHLQHFSKNREFLDAHRRQQGGRLAKPNVVFF
jgi:hypothetical protein